MTGLGSVIALKDPNKMSILQQSNENESNCNFKLMNNLNLRLIGWYIYFCLNKSVTEIEDGKDNFVGLYKIYHNGYKCTWYSGHIISRY